MNASPARELDLRFVFDQHVSGSALRQLRERGIDVVHVAEVGLASASDPDIFRWAVHEGRIVVTRNYRDFAPLVDAFVRQGIDFAGVLFYATSVRHSDVGHHVRALKDWIDESVAAGENLAENASAWLR